jgi:LmbE family N-acetylglucosaminyl deacetylase
MSSFQTDILVVSAHPDDAEFGAAGTLAKWIEKGQTVAYIICTSGDKGTSDRQMIPERLAQIRENEQRKAAELLGVKKVVFLRYRDQELEDTPEFRKEIVRQVRIYRPRTVVTSDPYRRYIWHRDHRIVGQVTLDAVFPYARDYHAYPDLISEGLEPHKVSELLFYGAEDINYRSDITATFGIKMEALKCHESQMAEMDIEKLETRLHKHSHEMAEGERYSLAEAFHRVKTPP